MDSDAHKKNRKRNFIVLGLIFLWIAIIWAVTMLKMSA